jgi:type I restriction enzyme S subunit
VREGWQHATLEELCVVDWGNTNLTKSSYIDGGTFLAVSAAGCDGRIGHSEHKIHTPVVSAIGAQCGRMFFPLEDFTAIKNTITLTPKFDKCVGKFLYYLLTFVKLPRRGAAQPFISKGDIQRFRVFCPCISEQKRVVAILDEAFEGIDRAIANTEKNLANAREVFESYLNSIFRGEGDQVPLSDLALDITDGDHSPPPKAASGVPFITISDIVKSTREIDFTNTFFVPNEYFRSLKANKKPKAGDVLYTVTGATLGIPVLVRDTTDFCFQRHIGLIRPKPSTDSAWLSYALLSKHAFNQATVGSTGAAQKTVSLSVLRNMKVPRMRTAEQCAVATKLDAISAAAHKLEVLLRRKLAALEGLKQAVMQKAFAGELTTRSVEDLHEAAA